MRVYDGPVSAAISARRSVRKFARLTIDGDTVERLVALACTAPAPHHSRPWRFVQVGGETREPLPGWVGGRGAGAPEGGWGGPATRCGALCPPRAPCEENT